MGEGRTMSDPGLLRRRPSSLEVGRAQRALVQLAALLAALAGLVNAIGFLAFGHVFLASPDANATVLGANLQQSYAVALFAGAMVLSFVAGVTLMTLIAHRATQFRRTLVLLTTALVLVAAYVAVQAHIAFAPRSEEHTSELQSLMLISYAAFCLNTITYLSQLHTA